MINININRTLDQLKSCEIKEHDLKPLMIKGVQFTFKPEIYLADDQIVLKTDISDSFDATMEKLVEQFDTYQNAIKWHNLKYICKSLTLKDDEKNGMSIHRWSDYGTKYPEIVQLIRYAVLNTFDKDLYEAHLVTDDLRIKNGCMWRDPDAIKFEVLGIEVQAYKNRKTILRGLSDEQYKRITDAFALYKKYR